MLIASEHKILDEFIASGRQLEQALHGLREEQLDLRAAPGEWSIRQIVHHLADDGDFWCFLVKRAIAQPGTEVVFGEFAGNDVWAAGLDTHQRSTRAALGLILAHRAYLAELADHFSGAWDRTVMVRDARAFSVEQVLTMLAEHMQEHVATIHAIRQANGL